MASVKRLFLIVFGTLVGVAAVLFALTNKQPVVLSFLYWDSMPLWASLWVFVGAAIGVLVASLVAFVAILRYRSRLSKANRRIRQLEGDLVSQRNLTLTAPLGSFPGESAKKSPK
ncbi:MAG: LapA family protein [Myxococcales bacterium]|nr:MAG: LapA family protein [Myxococcales bacterium]